MARLISETHTHSAIHMSRFQLIVVAGVTALCASGCGLNRVRSLEPEEARILPHAVFVNNDGEALEARVGRGSRPMTEEEQRAQLRGMMEAIRTDTASVVNGRRQVLIRIHGGLNKLNGSLDKSLHMRDSMMADPSTRYYPIFVNWESGLRSTYLEHLLFLSRGERRPWRPVLFPVYLAADMGGAVARAPLTWARQFSNGAKDGFRNTLRAAPDTTLLPGEAPGRFSGADSSLLEAQTHAWGSAGPAGDTTLKISRFGYRRSPGEAVLHHGSSIGLSLVPVKGLEMVLLDGAGRPAWDVMHRRTALMFRDVEQFGELRDEAAGYAAPRGAVAVFLDELERAIREDSATAYDITVIGHSMGAIVANEMIRTRPGLPWRNIVYMAPALSVREFETGTLPYLESHDSAYFYLLTLHPWAERREAQFARLVPYGSLLEWIDGYFAHPETPLDHMLGKYENATRMAFLFRPEVRGRIHVKAFGYNDGTGCGRNGALPYQHGQFNDLNVPFWHPEFWTPGTAGCNALKTRWRTRTTPANR